MVFVKKRIENINTTPVGETYASFTTDHRQKIIGVLLIFCVCSSKKFFIYNEELLVASSFIIFIFCGFNYFSDTVTEYLNSRGEGIKTELQNFLRLKQDFHNELIKEHKNIQNFSINLSKMAKFFHYKFRNSFTLSIEYSHETAKLLLLEKFETCSLAQLTFQQNLQKAMIKNFRESLFARFLVRALKNKSKKQALLILSRHANRHVSLV